MTPPSEVALFVSACPGVPDVRGLALVHDVAQLPRRPRTPGGGMCTSLHDGSCQSARRHRQHRQHRHRWWHRWRSGGLGDLRV